MLKRTLTPNLTGAKDSKRKDSSRSRNKDTDRRESNEVITLGTTPRIRINSTVVKDRVSKGGNEVNVQAYESYEATDNSDEIFDVEEFKCK